MKEYLKAATAPAAALVAAITFGAMMAPEARAGEFCRTDVTGHMTGCGFDTMEQCQAASSGVGGDCFRDPNKNDSANANVSGNANDSRNAYGYQPKSSHSKRGAAGTAANTSQ